MIFTMIYLKLRTILNQIERFLDILIDVFKGMKFLPSTIFSLHFSSEEICIDF